jgi:Ca2+-binding EF-hand superfamily protein
MGLGALLGALGGLIGGLAVNQLNILNPLQRHITYWLNTVFPNVEIDPSTAVELYIRGHIDLSYLIDVFKKHGYDENKAKLILETAYKRLSAEEYVALYLRGKITLEELRKKLLELGLKPNEQDLKLKLTQRLFTINEAFYLWRLGKINTDELKTILRAHGVDDKDFDKYELLTAYMPSPSDIIRFAVREVFTPEIVEKYKMYEDMPPQYIEIAKKLGIPEEVAKWYWYAHWDLPSLTMGFEMFRRKIISKEELELLMRTLDIMPGWREKLIQLAYEIPTRVDVRRMYELGVIDRNKVKEYYEKLGYSPEDAELLTRWTEVEYAQQDRDLTVKQVLELFEIGEFTRDEAKQYLVALGYPPNVAEYKLTLYEHEKAIKEAREQLQYLKELYINGKLSYEEFVEQMYKLPLSPITIKREIERADREKRKMRRLPSKAELKKWLKYGIIDLDTFKEYLRQMNYSDEDIERYVQEVLKASNIQELITGAE